MVNIAQILLLSLTVLAIVVTLLKYRQRRIDTLGFLRWLALWLGAGAAILFPESTITVAHLLGIGRGVDLVLYLSLILVFYLLFRTYVRLEQMDRDITKIVRAIALKESTGTRSQDKEDNAS